jgi:sulfite reductase (ferredoxin)
MNATNTHIDTSDHPRWSKLESSTREEIDVFETELKRVQSGQMSEKVFLEFRLRHGVYGQRQDGVQMLRIKIPLGIMTCDQMDVLADLSEENAVGISHITTRQDIQYHYIDINDTPNMMRRLAEVGITTKEACGNVVRNVCACPDSGCCRTEEFDVTPYARAMAYFLLRHPDGQNFGRKFKIAYSGCEHEACGLAVMHDIGAIAKVREVEGKSRRGFKVYIGGGLGAIPHPALVYSDFVPVGEMLPLAQAIARVFGKHGQKRNRARARMKFLLAKVGFDEFKRLVEEQLEKLPHDDEWTAHLDDSLQWQESPLRSGSELPSSQHGNGFQYWVQQNVRPQKQAGYYMATLLLPLGDITAHQLRGLAALCREYTGDSVRTTVDQKLLVRWIAGADLSAFYEGLRAVDLAKPGANKLADVTACPGTDSCKLGITSSRGLAGVLQEKFRNGLGDLAQRDDVRVKISGCFNACGQHHIADIGFFGSVKRKGPDLAPVFQVTLGGSMQGNASSFGLSVIRVPSKRAPDVIRTLVDLYDSEKNDGETFKEVMDRLGRKRTKEALDHLAVIEPRADAPELYVDNGQSWLFEKTVGVGECAGEVVDVAEFLLEDADRLSFESLLKLDEHDIDGAAGLAYQAMIKAADGLLSTQGLLLSDNYDTLEEFRNHFGHSSRRQGFFNKISEYLFLANAEGIEGLTEVAARKRVEEARLFIEESESVYARIGLAA